MTVAYSPVTSKDNETLSAMEVASSKGLKTERASRGHDNDYSLSFVNDDASDTGSILQR